MKISAATVITFAIAAALASAQQTQTNAAKPAPKAAPAASTTTKRYTPAKLPWGDPDLQGLWPAAPGTPRQRPQNLAGRAELTDAELAQREEQYAKQGERDG